ncbi:MAG: hypothetical protein EOO62_35180, partial [Hymenobacter sp.]
MTPKTLRTEADWVKAGGLLFEMPIDVDRAVISDRDVRDPALYKDTHMPLTKKGILPFARYVVQAEGKPLLGNLSCAMCHTRVQPGSGVLFQIKNAGLTVDGTLAGLTAAIDFDPAHPAQAHSEASAPVSSIQTGIALRDK